MALTEDNSCCEYRGDRRPRKKRWWRLPYERTAAEMTPTKSAKELRSCNLHLESGLRHSKWREPGSASDEASSYSSSAGLHFLRQVFCHGYVRYLLILLLCLECLSSRHVLAGTSEYKQLTAIDRSEICSSIDIRNSVDSFEQLSNCRVIDGFLQIVLMDRTSETDFANLTYPKLREITGYLLLYRVSGLKSLAHIFPNLAVIRGQDLFMNYAIAVYEMLNLEELGLHSLTDIQRGYVIITKNPLLCYVDTIDWSRIIHPNSTTDSNFIAENRAPNACPTCPSSCGYNNQTKQHLCWNAQYCQRMSFGRRNFNQNEDRSHTVRRTVHYVSDV